MHLYAQVLARVDELHQQREFVAELLIHLIADQETFVLVDEFGQRQPLVDVVHQSAIDGNTLMTRHTADLPTLADVRLCGIDAFKRCDLVTTPDGGLQIWLEFVGFHLFWLQR